MILASQSFFFTCIWITLLSHAFAAAEIMKPHQRYCSSVKQTRDSKQDTKMRKDDSTKVWPLKYEQLLHIEDHDFAMRPGFGGSPVPVGIDVQIESIDSISEINMVKKDVIGGHIRSFTHDMTMQNIMLRVQPDGNVLFSLRITVSAMCFMDFSRFPLDTQNCSLELESYAYNEEDLMLYWKHGNRSLNTD
ncbi:hypothetical protein mRhiFer1_005480 [Rhinolophus ferrumequinum]|uniref:Neurotransmitter-gated ion-channel ligand-binding domain-containing protein n=1 Tax=Rhinolophus ferrumequinum TaxID=59479 RepID=A0A7J8AEV4_RHIFE|nr:hypothetical protein mRhiFer1_005480 [Rhinolophus ferrumequinum]